MSYDRNTNTNNTSGNEFGRQNDSSFGSDFNQSQHSATNDSYGRQSNSNSQGVDSFGGLDRNDTSAGGFSSHHNAPTHASSHEPISGGGFGSSNTNSDSYGSGQAIASNLGSTGGGYGSTQQTGGFGGVADSRDDGFGSTERSQYGSTGGNARSNTNTDIYGSEGNTGISGDHTSHNDDSQNQAHKPTIGDKMRGGAEQIAGKMTKNQGLVEKGQERKAGELGNNSTADNY